jgi:hypothetical protein
MPCFAPLLIAAIPTDIVSKPYVEVCGDLNLVVLLHLLWHSYMFGGISCNPANAVGAAKIAMAYLGQYSHRMAHAPAARRNAVVNWLQSVGVLLPPETHRIHHATYDDAFPILNGVSAPLIKVMLKLLPDRRIWLVLFFVLSFTDIWAVSKLMGALTGIDACAAA